MTEATSEASSGPPPAVDLQDPLPESAFFWRRAFSYVVAVALIAKMHVIGRVSLIGRARPGLAVLL